MHTGTEGVLPEGESDYSQLLEDWRIYYERERPQEATMTPEERARRFVAKQSRDEWGEELETEDAVLLAAAIRAAENDVLDRAEEIVQEARGEGYDYRSIIHRIRALKHEPASKG